jgi:FlaA1/EpsC-like NDP-sugar epimerase
MVITGGTGFLGKRLALALKNRFEVILTGRNNKQNMVAEQFTGCKVLPMDVASIEAVRDVFVETRPDVVIHAAATKFVDLAERQPMECVDVNVVGSQNVARVAVEKGVRTVIGVSTDKATPPVRNTYGLSKAIMERMFCAMDTKADTRFACARYGNVAWSTGSVLPVWNKMHQSTGVIRTTGPDMRRFFFTVDEAVQLIVTLLDNIERHRGEVVSRQMRSALIRDILELWVQRKGGSWERMEGRPGERDDEYLVGELELPHAYEVTYGGVPHYAISFNRRSEKPLAEILSSANAERLTKEQIISLIENPPAEER